MICMDTKKIKIHVMIYTENTLIKCTKKREIIQKKYTIVMLTIQIHVSTCTKNYEENNQIL